ncbi:MAG: HEAT repeat domain-containing protein [Deltaproteobacteria bacterium]|nr:HEAT repeat domain-containing protein [Deltaproteobacteria bacterium]
MSGGQVRGIRFAAILGGTLALVAAGAHVFRTAPSASAPASTATPSRALGRLPSFEPGQSYVYAFTFRQSSSVDGVAAAGAMHGEVDVAGRLTLAAGPREGGAQILTASLSEVSRSKLAFMGADVLAREPEGLDGATALVDLEGGTVKGFRFDRRASPVKKLLLRSILLELGADLRSDGVLWSASEETPSGTSTAFYARTSDPRIYDRARRGYSRVTALGDRAVDDARVHVESRGRVTLGPEGALATVDDDETLRVDASPPSAPESATVRTLAHYELLATRPTQGEALSAALALEVWPRQFVPGVVESEEARLTRMAGGVDLPEIESQVERAALGAPKPGFLSQATAYLMLHPEACEALARTAIASDEKAERSRALAADLLASTGSPQAQKGLRDLAGSDVVRASATAERQILQRFTFVASPDAASIAFLEARRAEARSAKDADAEMACSFTLGAAARKLAAQGKGSEASRLVTELVTDLKASTSAERTRALLGALGNAAPKGEAKVIAPYARAKEPAVRAAAARALRSIDAPESREALRPLLSDDDVDVARSALGSLSQQSLSPSDVATIVDLTARGATPAELGNDLVTFLSSRLDSPDVSRALDALEARAPNDPNLVARIESVRQQLAMRSRVR